MRVTSKTQQPLQRDPSLNILLDYRTVCVCFKKRLANLCYCQDRLSQASHQSEGVAAPSLPQMKLQFAIHSSSPIEQSANSTSANIKTVQWNLV